jgi:hypothetical protein
MDVENDVRWDAGGGVGVGAGVGVAGTKRWREMGEWGGVSGGVVRDGADAAAKGGVTEK